MSWNVIQGHDSHVLSFERAVVSHRLAHGFLFVGPEGVGKHLFAVQLAKVLLCERRGDSFDSCDQCASCHLVDAGTHPDVVLAQKPEEKQEFPVDSMREVVEQLGLKPVRGNRRIAIIDDADYLNEESANCFLKTLEEPPRGAVLILIGVALEAQMETIRSRCQRVTFRRLPDATIRQLVGSDVVLDLLRVADGRPGVAHNLLKPELWPFRQSFHDALLNVKPDTIGLAKQWMALVEDAGKESAVQRQRARLILSLIIDVLRQGLTNPDSPLARVVDPDALLDKLDRALAAELHIDRNVQLVLAVEAAVDGILSTAGPAYSY